MEKEEYVSKLSKMIDVETINNRLASDLFKFEKYQKTLAELFPNLFKTFQKQLFHGSLLLSHKIKSNFKPICLMSHQDVVAPNGVWDSDPFKAEVRDGKLYGRGTLDTKGNFFAFAQAIEELLIEGFEFDRSIYIISSCNEEITGEGMKEITAYLKDNDISFDFVLDEGGMIVDNLFSDKGKLAMVALGEKQCVDVKFSITQQGGHASNPGKDTSLLALTRFIAKVNKYKGFSVYFEPTNEEMLRLVSSTCKGAKRFLFKHAHAFRHLLTKVFYSLSSLTRSMVKTTLCFTRIGASEADNVIPTTSWVVANIRISHHEGYDSCIQKLSKLAKKHKVKMEVLDKGYPSKISFFKSEQFAYLKKIITKVFPDVTPLPYIASGASDSRMADAVSENVFRFAPFPISSEQLGTIHGINENVDVSTLAPAVDFYKELIREL